MPLRTQTVSAAFHPDGAVLLDKDKGLLTTLNTLGSLVWQHLRDGRTFDEIVSQIVAQTGADAAVVRADVQDFIALLKTQSLLREEDVPE